MPEVRRQHLRQPDGAGWRFRLALEVIAELEALKVTSDRGKGALALAERLRVEPREISAVLETLVALDWVGRLSEAGGAQMARYVLLVDPAQTWVAPLAERLLVLRDSAADPVWFATGLNELKLEPLLSRQA
jgi:membrane protein